VEKDEGIENLRAAIMIIQCDSHPSRGGTLSLVAQWFFPTSFRVANLSRSTTSPGKTFVIIANDGN